MPYLAKKIEPAPAAVPPATDTDLVHPQIGLVLRRSAAFLVLLAALDQCVGLFGDWLSQTPYWSQKRVEQTSRLVTQPGYDTLVVGSCRADLFPEDLLSSQTQRNVLTRAGFGEGLGSLAFTLGLIHSHHTGKTVLIVLDDWILSMSRAEAAAEISHKFRSWELLDDESRTLLEEELGLNPWRFKIQRSGLVRYHGLGWQMTQATVDWLRNSWAPAPPRPTPEKRVMGRTIAEQLRRDPAYYVQDRQTQWRTNRFAVDFTVRLVNALRNSGNRPLLVLAPLHRLRMTPEVRRLVARDAREIQQRTRTELVDFLTPEQWWTDADELWLDPGHMTPEASGRFARQAAEQIGRLLSRP